MIPLDLLTGGLKWLLKREHSHLSFIGQIFPIIIFSHYVNFNVALCLRAFQDEEINQQSQLAEKLKQQMLDQEEVSARGSTGGGKLQGQCELLTTVVSEV